MEALEVLIPLLLILAAAVPKIKKANQKKSEAFRPAALPDLSAPAVDVPPAPLLAAESAHGITASSEKKEAFHSGFASLPADLPVREGVDPCHDDMFPDEDETGIQLETAQTSSALQSSEWVRGVVMGEILSSPKYKNFARK